MRLELDFDCKTITVKGLINLEEFISHVEKLNLDLKEWSVKSDISYFTYPSYPIVTYPLTIEQPYWTNPFRYSGTGDYNTPDTLTITC